jgi:hypothetical protein
MKKTTFLAVLILFLFLSPFLSSQESKFRVIADSAYLYLDPDAKSPVIEIVRKGDILTPLSRGKIKENWYHVSFYSKENFIYVTGFIAVKAIESIQVVSEIPKVTEKEKEELKEKMEELLYESPKEISVIIDQASVRAEPDFTSPVVRQMQAGNILISLAKTGEWYKVTAPPDEEGKIASGYIHQSFVEEAREKVEEAAKAEEQAFAPTPVPEIERPRVKNDYFKIGSNYFQFAESSRRNTYGEGIRFEAEVNVHVWKSLDVWVGSSYFYKSEAASRIKVFPFGAGLKYRLSWRMFNFYAGAGANYYQYEESTPTLSESKGEVGYVAKLGGFIKVMKVFVVDLHLNYSYCYLALTSQRVNIGGAEAGIAIGYAF